MVKKLRKKTGLSQREFASKFSIPVRTLQQWEQGINSPSPYVLFMLEKQVNNCLLPKFESKEKEKTYFDIAVTNYKISYLLLNNDEEKNLTEQVAFHLEQTVELAIKYLLDKSKVKYTRSQNIHQLIELGKNKKVDLYLTDYIENNTDMFTAWEANRDVANYKIDLKIVMKAYKEIGLYLKNIEKMD